MRIPNETLFPETPGREASPLDAFLLRKRSQLDHTALVEAQNAYMALMDAWVERAGAERTGADAMNVARDCVARHTRAVDEVMGESAMSADAKDAFRVWAKGRGTAACLRMAAFEDAQRREYALEQHDIRRGGIFRAAERQPEQYADNDAQLEEAHVLSVGQGLFPPAEAAERLARDRRALKEITFESLYAENPGKAVAAMAELGFDDARKERELRRFQADARAGELLEEAARRDTVRVLADDVTETMVAASLTGEGEGLRDLASRLREAGELQSAEELLRQADFFEDHAVVIRESAAMDLPALAGLIRKLEKAVHATESASHRGVLETELALRAAVHAHREAALAEDPAEAVADGARGETAEETVAYR
ncbi:MAG: hypothetical protein LIP28_08740, partial [Deltaproteobacteria bacterium]|nr:hypothetical protein [Deltaproteobacteria bacterium]